MNSGVPKSIPFGRSCWWFGVPLLRRMAVAEPLRPRGNSKNLTDPPGECQVPPGRPFGNPDSVEVGEPPAGVRLGVLHPAQQSGEHLAEDTALLLGEVLEQVLLE